MAAARPWRLQQKGGGSGGSSAAAGSLAAAAAAWRQRDRAAAAWRQHCRGSSSAAAAAAVLQWRAAWRRWRQLGGGSSLAAVRLWRWQLGSSAAAMAARSRRAVWKPRQAAWQRWQQLGGSAAAVAHNFHFLKYKIVLTLENTGLFWRQHKTQNTTHTDTTTNKMSRATLPIILIFHFLLSVNIST